MADTVKKGGKKNRKYKRNEKKCVAYRNAHTRERNKLKRILQSNGYAAACEYARKNGLKEPAKRNPAAVGG